MLEKEISLRIYIRANDPYSNNGGGTDEISESKWEVFAREGYLKQKSTDKDSLAFLICHEIGHFLGGRRFFASATTASEGQADYYAVTKCMRRYFKNKSHEKFMSLMRKKLNPTVVQMCNKQWGSESHQSQTCQRVSIAGENFLKALYNKARFSYSTPSKKIAPVPYNGHPSVQCRADTFMQGSLCQVSANVLISKLDPLQGTCNLQDGHVIGNRPLCWFNEEMALEAY